MHGDPNAATWIFLLAQRWQVKMPMSHPLPVQSAQAGEPASEQFAWPFCPRF
jgi:hypothetical protein